MQSVIERKRRPTSKYTQQPNQSPKEQVQKSNTSHAEEACRLRAGRRASACRETRCSARRETRGSARRETRGSARWETRRSARRETRRSAHRETRRAARRETRELRAGRRAGCTPEDVPGRAVCAPGARSVRARGRPVRPFSSRSGLPELRGRAAGGRRHARRGPQVRRASPAHLRALARLEPKPGRREVPPGFAVRFRRQKESEAKHTKKTRRFKSQARACAVESS